MKKLFLIATVLVFTTANIHAETVDKIVAKVGSDVITMSELNTTIQARKVGLMQKPGDKEAQEQFAKFKANALNEMVLQKILESEIKREKISVTTDAVENEFKNRVKQSGASEPEFVSQLARFGLSLSDYKASLKKELEQRQFVEKKIMPTVNVSDYDLQKEYEQNQSKFQRFSKVRFIEVMLTPEKLPDQNERMNVASTIRDGLAKGRSVSDLIKKYSSGAFAAQGGDSGLIDLDNLRGDLQQLLAQLKPGQTTDVMSTGEGVYVFKLLTQTDPKPLPFNLVSNAIRGRFTEKAVQEHLRKYLMAVKDQTYIEILQ